MPAVKKIRGVTPEERQVARRIRTSRHRADYYQDRIGSASGKPRTQLRRACDYLLAVADDRPSADVSDMVREVRQLAERWNQP